MVDFNDRAVIFDVLQRVITNEVVEGRLVRCDIVNFVCSVVVGLYIADTKAVYTVVVGNLFVLYGAVELSVTLVEVNCLRVEGGTDLLGVDPGGNVDAVTV